MDFRTINKDNYSEFLSYLKSLGDEKYRNFHGSLVKDTDSYIIGVRIPVLRSVAKDILKGDVESFLASSGREYYEEIMLRGLVTAQIKGSYKEIADRVDGFIDYIDNWAVCDTFCSTLKCIKKFPEEFFGHINTYLKSENLWAKRVGLVLMMNYYLTDEYIDRVLERVDKIQSSEYYVQMGKAWLLATAFAKYRDKTLDFLKSGEFDNKTFNMTVQKCVDSYRVSKEDKEYLKTLRRR